MAMCCKCQTTDDLYLNDILQIICKQCSSDTVTHKYNSELDNYRLGLKTPGSMIFCIRLDCTYIDDEDICFNCHKKGHISRNCRSKGNRNSHRYCSNNHEGSDNDQNLN